MTEMFGEAWSPMSVPDLAPDDDDRDIVTNRLNNQVIQYYRGSWLLLSILPLTK